MKGWSLRYSLISKRKAGKRFRLWSVKYIFFLPSRKLSSQSCSHFWKRISLLLNGFQVLIAKSFDFAFVKRILRLLSVLFSYLYIMKKGIKLYNVIFPIWMLLFLPPVWLVVFPANFAIDSLVFRLGSKFAKLQNILAVYKKSILKIWGFGFLADLLGAGFLFLSFALEKPFWRPYEITAAISHHPWKHPIALTWTVGGLLIAGVSIFFFNYYWSFAKTDLTSDQKKKLALALAVFTTPYLFLFPLDWFMIY